jgi:hypothetical protein
VLDDYHQRIAGRGSVETAMAREGLIRERWRATKVG